MEHEGALLLDTSFLVSLANERDAHHQKARELQAHVAAGRYAPLLLPEYVFLETVTVLLARRGIELARRFGSALLASREIEFVPCSGTFETTWATFQTSGGSLSFADAAIVGIARAREPAAAATFDAKLRAALPVKALP